MDANSALSPHRHRSRSPASHLPPIDTVTNRDRPRLRESSSRHSPPPLRYLGSQKYPPMASYAPLDPPSPRSPYHSATPSSATASNGAHQQQPYYQMPSQASNFQAYYPPYQMAPPPPQAYHSGPGGTIAAGAPPSPTTPRGTGAPAVKRKRKSESAQDTKPKHQASQSDDDAQGSQSDSARASAAALAAAEAKKRTKTQRACDSCRSRKIRCDVIIDADPPHCQHCKQYAFECTFFLPITETRFKKKKIEEEAATKHHPAAINGVQDLEMTRPRIPVRETSSPRSDSKGDVKVYGPTFVPYLAQSTSSIPKGTFEKYDLRHHHTWEVGKSGDGFIQVFDPSLDPSTKHPMPAPIDLRIGRDVLERLVNSYFATISSIFPVVTQSDFLENQTPAPILLYAVAIVAATQRDVPQPVFDALRLAVNTAIRGDDILSNSSTVNVQALLVLGMCGDAHSAYVPLAVTALWQRVGAAIRMAQDLGLHRAEAVKKDIELRRRVWGACVISDRWCSLTYGHPFMIDVQDCDARLPSAAAGGDTGIGDACSSGMSAVEYAYMNELIKLSVLLGRVLKMIYSPSGLVTATDAGLIGLLNDLDSWQNSLHPDLRYQGPDTAQLAGLLHLLYSCVCMIFWRVFMRISYQVPSHLTFSLSVERWSALVQMTRESIDWLDRHERIYDTWLLVAYAATSCALVQYHTWARRRDPEAQASLKKLRDCVRRWEEAVKPEHMSTRRRTSEIISLLYESTTQRPDQAQAQAQAQQTPTVNPTVGVSARAPDSFRGLTFKKDTSRPGGGVYVAEERLRSMSELPEGTFVMRNEKDGMPMEVEGEGMAPRQSSSQMMLPQDLAVITNMNPDLNDRAGGHVQVLNMLDGPGGMQEQLTVADSGLLEGIPGGMFDWDQWDDLFSRFSDSANGGMHSGDPILRMQPTGIVSTFGAFPYTPALYPAGANSYVDR